MFGSFNGVNALGCLIYISVLNHAFILVICYTEIIQPIVLLVFPYTAMSCQKRKTNQAFNPFFFMLQIDVNGKNAASLYKFLKSEKGCLITDAIKWNFTKFLVNKEGKVLG